MIGSLIQNLQQDIALLQRYIDQRSGAGFHDVERMVEALCIPLFRAWKGYDLQNMNQIRVNYPAIDFADAPKRVAVQVTTKATPSKIRETVRVYENENFPNEYDRLYIFGFIKVSKERVPSYCTVVGIDAIITDLYDRGEEEDVQEVLDAVQRHQSYSSLHPWDDRNCLEIVLNYIDRNAIKHVMAVEGSAKEMVKGLNEISELIGKGQVQRRTKSKSINDFEDVDMKIYLRKVMDVISQIVSIVNSARAGGSDLAIMEPAQMNEIDKLKATIVEESNRIARRYNIPVVLSMKWGFRA